MISFSPGNVQEILARNGQKIWGEGNSVKESIKHGFYCGAGISPTQQM
jgi:hypothetical protein